MNRTPSNPERKPRPFLGVQFQCCNTYGRAYRNQEQTAYEGRCPRCGKRVRFLIGADGEDSRFYSVS